MDGHVFKSSGTYLLEIHSLTHLPRSEKTIGGPTKRALASYGHVFKALIKQK